MGECITKGKIKKLTIEKIQSEYSNLNEVTFLNLSNRGIETIVALDGLNNVKKVDFSDNKLKRLNNLKSFKSITWFKAIGNKLSGEGIEDIKYMKNLVTLNLGGNTISRIPSDCLRHMRQLKALVLNDNRISSIEWIPRLPELNSLILSQNRITMISEGVLQRLSSLQKISLSHNKLKELPDMSALTQLNELRATHNQINTIPIHLSKNENLKILDMGHNEIDDWDGIENLKNLETLRQLNLRGNPIYGKPMDLKENHESKEPLQKKNIDTENQQTVEMSEKELKRLDAKNKQYNFKMKRLFPELLIRDGHRLISKRSHGYVPPPKIEKQERKEKTNKKRFKKEQQGDKKCKNQRNSLEEAKDEAKDGKISENIDPTNEKKAKKEKRRNSVDSCHKQNKKIKKDETKDELKKVVNKKESIKSNPSDLETKSCASEDLKEKKRHTDDEKKKKKKKRTESKKNNTKVNEKGNKENARTGVVGVVVKRPKNNTSGIPALNIEGENFDSGVGLGGTSSWD